MFYNTVRATRNGQHWRERVNITISKKWLQLEHENYQMVSLRLKLFQIKAFYTFSWNLVLYIFFFTLFNIYWEQHNEKGFGWRASRRLSLKEKISNLRYVDETLIVTVHGSPLRTDFEFVVKKINYI